MGLEKIVKDKKNTEDKKEKAKTIGSGAIGAKLIHGSKDRLLGQKTLYHGTSKKNWESIKKEGLQANRGGARGAGAAILNDGYQAASKGKVHLTGDKYKALLYNRVNAASDALKKDPKFKEFKNIKSKYRTDNDTFAFKGKEGQAASKRFDELNTYIHKKTAREMFNPKNKDGKTLKVKMNYDKWKNNFEVDPDETGVLYKNIIKGNLGDRIGKHKAARGAVNVGTDEIVGLHKTSKRLKKTMNNLPNYIKGNKGRFGTGVAMAGIGGAMVGNAISRYKNVNNNEKKASYKEMIYKEAREYQL